MFGEYLGRLPQFKNDIVEDQCISLDDIDRENIVKTQSDWQRGAASARDEIICTIIGMQNALGDWDDPKQAAYQDVMNRIIKNLGDLYQPYKL